MVAAKRLGLLLILQYLLFANVAVGSKTNSRQLDIPAMQSYFARAQLLLKESKIPRTVSGTPDVSSGGALQSDVQDEQLQQESSCGIYSVNCSNKTLLLGGATDSMSIRRPDTVNLGVPIKIPVNSQTPAYNDQKVLTGRYGTLQNYRTTDLKSAYISDWTPITLVKQTPSPPPLHKPSVPSLGVPIKTPTSNVFHARTNYKVGDTKIVGGGTLGKFAGRNNGQDNMSYGKPIKWSASDPKFPAPSFRSAGQQNVPSPQKKPFKASTPIVATNNNKKTIGDFKTTTNKSQRSNTNSADEVKHASPSPGVSFSENIHNPNNDVRTGNPTRASSDFDSGIIPISLLPLSPISEFLNPNLKDSLPVLKVSDTLGDESVFNIPTTKKPTTPNSQALIRDNFDDGRYDDVGVVSSFSYFHHPEWSKGFEEYFTSQAGGKIAKQFHNNMFDHAGFPGKIRKSPTVNETNEPRDGKESDFFEKKKRNESSYLRRMQVANNPKTRTSFY